MGKHKKKVREEKTKTKLKGAVLQKGLNVTKTEFKVRKIVIRDQLRTAAPDEIQSSRKINIKECISRLQHHNLSFRTEALRNLKEIVTNFPDEVVSKYLNDVITNVAKLALDVERSIRQESFKVLGLLLTASPDEYILPFFEVLSSYTRCAMTHIQPRIQEDSLLLLDTLIARIPSLISSNSDKLFASFLNMMSKFRSETKSERTVTINLGNKQTSSKWRNKILERLFKMLEAIISEKLNSKKFEYEYLKRNTLKEPTNAFDAEDDADEKERASQVNDDEGIKYFRVDKAMHFPMIYSHYNRNCSLTKLFVKSQQTATSSGDMDEGERIKNYVETLMPLLTETWLEVRPSAKPKTNNPQSIITVEAAFTLKIILQIMDQLWTLMRLWDAEVKNDDMTNWFRIKYTREFTQNFVESFPYIQGESSDNVSGGKKKKGTTEKEVLAAGGTQCIQQNLMICFVFCCVNRTIKGNDIRDYVKILGYVDKYVKNVEYVTSEMSNYFIKVFQLILVENGNHWNKINTETTNVLKSVLILYESKNISKNCRDKIMVLLCDIILNDKLLKNYGESTFNVWIPTLTKMLSDSQSVSLIVLRTFSMLAKQKNQNFLENLNRNSINILENLMRIKILGINNQFEGRKLLINLFYWMDVTTVREVLTKLNSVQLEDDIRLYLKDILMLKINNQ